MGILLILLSGAAFLYAYAFASMSATGDVEEGEAVGSKGVFHVILHGESAGAFAWLCVATFAVGLS